MNDFSRSAGEDRPIPDSDVKSGIWDSSLGGDTWPIGEPLPRLLRGAGEPIVDSGFVQMVESGLLDLAGRDADEASITKFLTDMDLSEGSSVGEGLEVNPTVRWRRERIFIAASELFLGRKHADLASSLRQSLESERRLQLALWASGDGIWEWTKETGKILVERFDLGGEKVQWSSKPFDLFDAIDEDDKTGFQTNWMSHVDGRSTLFFQEFRFRHGDSIRWLRICGRALERSASGSARKIAGTVHDITTEKKDEESLRLLARMFSTSSDGLVIVDEHFRILEANAAYQEMIYNNPAMGRKCLLSAALNLGSGPVNALRDGSWEGLCDFREDKRKRVLETRVTRVNARGKKEQRFIVALRDVTEREKAKSDLERMATQDPLTGLPNRTAIDAHLQIRLMAENAAFGLLFVDIDGFKGVNDSYGHGAGDLLLAQVAKRLRQVVDSSFVGRWSGDAFVVIVPHGLDETVVYDEAQAIRRTLNMPYEILSQEVSITPSIGGVFFPKDGKDVIDLIQKGDAALYAAKDRGRNRVEFFRPVLEDGAQRRAQLKGLMRLDADRNEFKFMVQSKVNAQGEVIGAEILMRWTTDAFGSVSPAEFIPMAEQSGLIHTLGKTALHEAAKLAARLAREGHNFPIAVNIAPRQFQNSDIEAVIVRVCEDHGVEPWRIEIELTESALVSGVSEVAPVLERLRKRGFSLALDDFGTGYSSLSHIQHLPFDKIKIDRVFVKDLPGDAKSLCVLKSIIMLCKGLGLGIVAEGIETDLQLQTLVGLGVTEFQGFMFSRPAPIEDWFRGISPAISVTR